jgi:hypothetical protein
MESWEPLEEFFQSLGDMSPGHQYEELLGYFGVVIKTWDARLIRVVRARLALGAEENPEFLTLIEVLDGQLALREIAALPYEP